VSLHTWVSPVISWPPHTTRSSDIWTMPPHDQADADRPRCPTGAGHALRSRRAVARCQREQAR
ncbi:MAG: hypothetical protein ACRDQF_17190, partial [Thermocrispum sp.]